MRKLVVLAFVTLDRVMQAPGGPKEDTSGDFKYGGWTVPYFDEFSGKIMGEQNVYKDERSGVGTIAGSLRILRRYINSGLYSWDSASKQIFSMLHSARL